MLIPNTTIFYFGVMSPMSYVGCGESWPFFIIRLHLFCILSIYSVFLPCIFVCQSGVCLAKLMALVVASNHGWLYMRLLWKMESGVSYFLGLKRHFFLFHVKVVAIDGCYFFYSSGFPCYVVSFKFLDLFVHFWKFVSSGLKHPFETWIVGKRWN